MKLPPGRPKDQLIDNHDVARYTLSRAGGLRRYMWIEAGRALARGAGMIPDHVSKLSWWVRKPT